MCKYVVGEHINKTLAFLCSLASDLRLGHRPGEGKLESPTGICNSNIGAHRVLGGKNPRCQEKEQP
jgi:hypothetical protein